MSNNTLKQLLERYYEKCNDYTLVAKDINLYLSKNENIEFTAQLINKTLDELGYNHIKKGLQKFHNIRLKSEFNSTHNEFERAHYLKSLINKYYEKSNKYMTLARDIDLFLTKREQIHYSSQFILSVLTDMNLEYIKKNGSTQLLFNLKLRDEYLNKNEVVEEKRNNHEKNKKRKDINVSIITSREDFIDELVRNYNWSHESSTRFYNLLTKYQNQQVSLVM